VDKHAPLWLESQFSDVLALRASGIPVHGFTWYSLTDQIDWQHALREERNDLYPVGLFDLDRRPRAVAGRYRDIIARWKDELNAPAGSQAQRYAHG
jgi:beta-glucosidase/6-phospho-beta-glucosidase/beta-galactosidase